MNKLDQILVAMIGISIPIILTMSGANVYSVLIGTGEDIYISNPFIAVTLAGLAPISSIALKLVGSCFSSTAGKQRYAVCVYTITGLSVLAWCVLYSLTYSAPTGEIDISLDAPSYLSNALLFIQLFTEIAVGTGLFVGLETILSKYQATPFRPNAKLKLLEKLFNAQKQKHEHLLNQLSKKKEQLGQLNALRQAAINEASSRFNAAQSLSEQLKQL